MRAYRTTGPQRERTTARRVDEVASARGPATWGAVEALQRSAGNRAVGTLLQRQGDEAAGDHVRSVLRAGGAPLDVAIRTRAEQFLDADLSQVRVHTGGAAAESARAVDARAYTSGSDIVFGSGQYDTTSSAGQQRLAHELTHVVQQQRGPVAGTTTAGGLKISDPSDRFEREAERLGIAFVTAGQRRQEASALPEPNSLQPATSVSSAVQRVTITDLDTGETAEAISTPQQLLDSLPAKVRQAILKLPTIMQRLLANLPYATQLELWKLPTETQLSIVAMLAPVSNQQTAAPPFAPGDATGRRALEPRDDSGRARTPGSAPAVTSDPFAEAFRQQQYAAASWLRTVLSKGISIPSALQSRLGALLALPAQHSTRADSESDSLAGSSAGSRQRRVEKPTPFAGLLLPPLAGLPRLPTAAEIPLLPPAHVEALSRTQFGQLGKDCIRAFAPWQVGMWRTQHLKAITATQASALSADQLKVFGAAQLAVLLEGVGVHLASSQLQSLTVAQLNALIIAAPSALDSIPIGSLAPRQVAEISPKAVAHLTAAHLNALNREQVASLTPAQIARLTDLQVSGLDPTQLARFDGTQLSAIDPARIPHLASHHLTVLTASHTASLTEAQLTALTAAQTPHLRPAALGGISPAVMPCLTAAHLNALNREQVASLTPAQIAHLTDPQVNGLDPTQLKRFDGAQLGAIKPARVRSLTQAQLETLAGDKLTSLSTDQLAGLTHGQVGMLSSTQIEMLSDEQQKAAFGFDDDLMKWAREKSEHTAQTAYEQELEKAQAAHDAKLGELPELSKTQLKALPSIESLSTSAPSANRGRKQRGKGRGRQPKKPSEDIVKYVRGKHDAAAQLSQSEAEAEQQKPHRKAETLRSLGAFTKRALEVNPEFANQLVKDTQGDLTLASELLDLSIKRDGTVVAKEVLRITGLDNRTHLARRCITLLDESVPAKNAVATARFVQSFTHQDGQQWIIDKAKTLKPAALKARIEFLEKHKKHPANALSLIKVIEPGGDLDDLAAVAVKQGSNEVEWLVSMAPAGVDHFNSLVKAIANNSLALKDVKLVYTTNTGNCNYSLKTIRTWISSYYSRLTALAETLVTTNTERCELFVVLSMDWLSAQKAHPQFFSLLRIESLLQSGRPDHMEVYQRDVRYQGDDNKRTGFLRFYFTHGGFAEIHTHWNVNVMKIESMHIQWEGTNGTEINTWKQFARTAESVLNAHNRETGEFKPTAGAGRQHKLGR